MKKKTKCCLVAIRPLCDCTLLTQNLYLEHAACLYIAYGCWLTHFKRHKLLIPRIQFVTSFNNRPALIDHYQCVWRWPWNVQLSDKARHHCNIVSALVDLQRALVSGWFLQCLLMLQGLGVPTEHPGKISSGPTTLFGVPDVTVCACIRFPCVIRSGYLVLANQHTSSKGQGSRDLRQTRVEPYWIEIVGHSSTKHQFSLPLRIFNRL